MGRKPLVNNEHILAVARDIFLEHGARATMTHVAEKLGVSEAAIFKRFGTRDHLFAEAMRPEHDLPPFLVILEEKLGNTDFESAMLEAGYSALTFCRQIAPISMMIWANPSLNESRDDVMPPPITALNAVVQFLNLKMNTRAIPKFDANTFVRMYFGGIYAFALIELLHPVNPNSGEIFVKSSLSMIINPLVEKKSALNKKEK